GIRSITELASARTLGPDRKLVDRGIGSPTAHGVGCRSTWSSAGEPWPEVAPGPGVRLMAVVGGSGAASGAGTGLRWREGWPCAAAGTGGKCSENESRLYMVAPRKAEIAWRAAPCAL